MRRRLNAWRAAAGWVALLALPLPVLAHERWFVQPEVVGATPPFFRSWQWQFIPAFLACVITLVLFQRADHWLRSLQFGRLFTVTASRIRPWAPTIVGLITAGGVLSAAFQRTALAPDLVVPDTTLGTMIVLVEFGIAVALVLGFGVRIAAVALIGIAVWSFAFAGLLAVQNMVYIGLGIFLLLWGRGRLSLGAAFSQIMFSFDTAHMRPVALSVLRILTGVTLLWAGIDKLVHPELHMALLSAFSENPYTFLHVLAPWVSRDTYLLSMATGEITLSLLLVTGWLLRCVALFLLATFVVFTIWFGWKDLIGHLPFIAAFLVFLSFGRTQERQEA